MPYYGMGGDMMEKASMDASVSPAVPTGENTIMVRVNVTYEVK